MHVAKCPECGAALKMSKAIVNGKIRCSKCKTNFVGSTKEIDPERLHRRGAAVVDPNLAAAAGEVRKEGSVGQLHIYHQTGRPKAPVWVVPVTVMALVLLIPIVWLAVYHAMHPTVVVQDKEGRVLKSVKTSQHEADRIVEEAKARDARPAEVIQPAARPAPSPHTPARAPNPAAPAPAASAAPTGDRNVIVDARVAPTHEPTEVQQIVGRMQNKYDRPLLSAEISLWAKDEGGTWRPIGKAVCRHIPPRGFARFSYQLGLMNLPDNPEIRGVASNTVPAGPEAVCWSVEEAACRRRDEGHKIIITGRARNPYSYPVRVSGVFADFYDDRKVWLESQEGQLDEKVQVLAPGKAVSFRVELDTSTRPFALSLVRSFEPRILGSKL